MRDIEITHKTTTVNGGGQKVDAYFVGPQGTWSIAYAGRLTLSRTAQFLHHGEKILDLAMLPEQIPAGVSIQTEEWLKPSFSGPNTGLDQ